MAVDYSKYLDGNSLKAIKNYIDNNFLKLSGGSVTGELKLYAASGDSPRLTFQRGTLTDTYNDWSLYDSGGYFYIQQRGSGSTSWETRATFTQSGVNFAGTISENGTALSSLYQAKGSYVVANTAITGATKCKITYDSKGLITSGANLSASDIPSLAASKITSGTFAAARIPDLSSTYSTVAFAKGLMTPSFVASANIASRSLPSQYVGGSGGYYLQPGTRNAARFYVGTVGANSNGIYVFTYAGIMLMFVCYGMTANIYYMSYGAVYDGSYGGGRYYYYIDSSGYLTIFSTSNSLPSGYTAYLHKLKMY